MWYRDAVKVERMVDAGRSATGSPLRELQVILPALKCDIVFKTQEVIMPDNGQTVISTATMTTPLGGDVRAKDIVTDNVTGERFEVISVLPYRMLPRLVATLKSGVV